MPATVVFFLATAAMTLSAVALCVRAPLREGDRGPFPALSRAAAVLMAVLVPLAAGTLYLHVGTPAAIHPGGPAGSAPGEGLDMDSLIERLRERVRADPSDTRGQRLLARTLMALGRHQEAIGVIETLHRQAGETAETLVLLADALAMTRGGALEGEPLEIVGRALGMDPENTIALWLSGAAADRRGDHALAADFFARAAASAEDPEQRGQLLALERRARASAAETGDGASAAAPAAEVAPPGIRLRVEVAPALAGQARDSDTLFVFAREADGPPMPISVARLSAGELPAMLTLDDRQAMTPTRKLSDFSEVKVVARISRSGVATPSPGDLYGELAEVRVGADSVHTVTIDRSVP